MDETNGRVFSTFIRQDILDPFEGHNIFLTKKREKKGKYFFHGKCFQKNAKKYNAYNNNNSLSGSMTFSSDAAAEITSFALFRVTHDHSRVLNIIKI